MFKAYKYKLIPNQEQIETLSKYFGSVRFVYNWGLNRKIETHKENGKPQFIPLTYIFLKKFFYNLVLQFLLYIFAPL